jgi:hypothetical protein
VLNGGGALHQLSRLLRHRQQVFDALVLVVYGQPRILELLFPFQSGSHSFDTNFVCVCA